MKSIGTRTLVIMIAVCAWAVLMGGIVYSNAILMPAFLGHLPDSASVVNGPYGINEAAFWMTIHPVVILLTLLSLIFNWRVPARRKLIASSLAVYVLVIVVTAIYFIPELITFAAGSQSNIPPAELAARASRWRLLSWIRAVVMFAIFVPMLLALVCREE
jgi:hypothetical protein